MPGNTISVGCVECPWEATLSEGAYVTDLDAGTVVSMEPCLCAQCHDIVTIKHGGGDAARQTARCPGCGGTDLRPWPGRDQSLLLEEAADSGRLGHCPKCDGAVIPHGKRVLWD